MIRQGPSGAGVRDVVVDGSRVASSGWVTVDLDRLPFGPGPATDAESTFAPTLTSGDGDHADRYRVEIDTGPPLRPTRLEAENGPLSVAPGLANDNDPSRQASAPAEPSEAVWPLASRVLPAPGLAPRRSRTIPEADVIRVGRATVIATQPNAPRERGRIALWLLSGVDRAAWRRIVALSLMLIGSAGNLLYQRLRPEPHAIVVPVPENPRSMIT